jgi:hypothetical protein
VLNYDDLLAVTTKYFPDQTARVGRSSLEIIIDDFVELGAEGVSFERPEGGHNYDRTAELSLIVAILQLLVSVSDILARETRNHSDISNKDLIEIVRPQIESKSEICEFSSNEELLNDLVERIKANE